MRTYTDSGITITYPEQFVLHGNRNIISISGATTKTTFSMFGDERELSSGAGEFNLQPYLKSAFATVGKTAMFSPLSITENLLLDGVTFKAVDLTQVYFGANEFGDKRVLVQHAEYTEFSPFFDFWLPVDMEARINGVDTDFVQGFNHVDLSAYTGDVEILFSVDGFTTFDDTFDYTFTGDTVSIRIHRVECPENGFLMRWIDHLGIWQQKTFDILSTNRAIERQTYNWNEQPTSNLLSGLKFQENSKSNSVALVAEMVDLTEAKRLSEVVGSQFVHAYDFNNSMWIPAIVTTNDMPILENKGRQNININVALQNGY